MVELTGSGGIFKQRSYGPFGIYIDFTRH